MRTMRQDAWTAEDDKALAEIILRHIREGSTQLSAFEECAEKLGRTEAACGYRWNACVRKNFKTAIENAKVHRKELKTKQRKTEREKGAYFTRDGAESALSWEEVLSFLKEFRQQHLVLTNQTRQIERDLQYKIKENAELKVIKERYESELHRLRSEYEAIREDYKALVSIMERARKLTLLHIDSENSNYRPRFRMDANGNLERYE